MGAVAFVTEQGNKVTIGNEISAIAAPAFVKANIGMNHMAIEDLPSQALTKKLRKDGSMTVAGLLVESTALALAATSELTETSVTATAAKAAIVSGVSVESERFGGYDVASITEAQYAAIARYVDNDWLGLFGSLSVTQTCASVATIDDLLQAQLAIYNANCPNQEVTLSGILGPRAVYNLKKEIIQSGAAAWANPNTVSLLRDNKIQANRFIGSVPGVCDVYQTTGFGTSGGDDVQALVHPMWAHAGMFDSAPSTWLTNKGSEGFYREAASYYFYDVLEYNDLAGVGFLSDT